MKSQNLGEWLCRTEGIISFLEVLMAILLQNPLLLEFISKRNYKIVICNFAKNLVISAQEPFYARREEVRSAPGFCYHVGLGLSHTF